MAQLERGNCFESAFKEFLNGRVSKQLAAALNLTPVLVHGYPRCTAPELDGEKMSHAWVEVGDLCIDYGDVIPNSIYYSVGNIDPAECVRYGREALGICVRKHHYGPWTKMPPGTRYRDRSGRLRKTKVKR